MRHLSLKMTRRTLFGVSILGITAVLTDVTLREAANAVTVFLPYTADSFFKSKVAGAPVDVTRTAAFRKFMTSFSDQKNFSAPTIKGLGTNKWGTAYAVGQSGDPMWKLTGSVPSDVAWLKTTGFHAPDSFGKQISGTSDSPFVVQDMANGWSVWAAKAALAGTHTINVGAAGAFKHSSNGLDKRNKLRDAAGSGNFRSRGAIPDGMVIRRDLVDFGIANNTGLGHVLHMFMTATGAGHCHPMVGDEGDRGGFGAEGERIFINPAIDLTKRGLSPFGLVIARTLQQHGCYIGDNAGGESTLKAEQTSSAKNPWSGLVVSQTALLGKVTWADFMVAKQGWQ